MLGLFSAISAAETTAEKPSEEQVSEPAAIPFGLITVRASAIKDSIKQVKARLSDTTVEKEVSEELAQTDTQAETAKQQLDAILKLRHTTTQLQALRIRWENLGARISAVNAILEEQMGRIEAELDEAAKQTKIWRLTQQEARKSSTPVTIRNRVKEMLDALKLVDGELTKSRSRMLVLQNRISKSEDFVKKALERIAMARKELGSALFERQDQLLLNVWPKLDEFKQQLGGVENRMAGMGRELATYTMVYIDRLVIQIILIVALGLYLARKRLESTHHAGHGDPKSADLSRDGFTDEILKHPWAIALLFGILLTPFLYPGTSTWIKTCLSLLRSAGVVDGRSGNFTRGL